MKPKARLSKLKKLSLMCGGAFAVVITSACSQGIDAVAFEKRGSRVPTPYTYLTDTDLQGASPVAPGSSNFQLQTHRIGGTTVQTQSSSASFKLSSGVVIN